jgi:hypothetical protein
VLHNLSVHFREPLPDDEDEYEDEDEDDAQHSDIGEDPDAPAGGGLVAGEGLLVADANARGGRAAGEAYRDSILGRYF